MTTLREAAQQALEALESADVDPHSSDAVYRAIDALKAALVKHDKDRVKVEEMKANWNLQRKLVQETEERDKQRQEEALQRLTDVQQEIEAALAAPVQEPVAWQWLDTAHFRKKIPAEATPSHWRPLYTAPPQRKPLAEWQITDLMANIDPEDVCSWSFREGVYAAEKHHGVRP